MLYDNGQMVSLYSEGFTCFKSDLYKQTVYETLEFIERELSSPEGGFYSALDADSEGVEGKYYCWTAGEIAQAGLPRPDVFTAYYNITEPGNWEGTNVLRRLYPDKEIARRFDLSTEELVQIIEEGKKQLMQIRERSEEHTSELQSLMRISYAVFCLKKKKTIKKDR